MSTNIVGNSCVDIGSNFVCNDPPTWPVGLELGAARLELDITSGAVALKAARLTLAARGGIGCDGDTDTDANGGGFGGFSEADDASAAVPLVVAGGH